MKEENQTIIKALNMFGRVPETWELLNYITNLQEENERLRTVLNGSEEKRKRTIEYIKSNYIDNPIEFKKDLLSILN